MKSLMNKAYYAQPSGILPQNQIKPAKLPAKQESQPFMTSTHQYYSAQHFYSKAEEEQENGGSASPDTALSICIEDSFGDLMMDNDTSERHIVVHVQETPPRKQERQYIPQNVMNSQGSNTVQSRYNQKSIATNTDVATGMKYSVAMPIPQTNVTPGQKSTKSSKFEGLSDPSAHQNPKHLQFIDKINEETMIDGGNSISTGPSISGLDLIMVNPNSTKNQSRQQKVAHLYKHPIYGTNFLDKAHRPLNYDLKVTKESSLETLEGLQSARSTNPTQFHAKMEEFVQKKEEKIKRMREEKAQKELQNCVFSPTIYTRKAHHQHGSSTDEHPPPVPQPQIQRRNLDQFLQDQQRFVEIVRHKRELRQEEKDHLEIAQVQHGPFVSQRSRQILNQRQQRTLSRENNSEDGVLAEVNGRGNVPFSSQTKKLSQTMHKGSENLPPQVKRKNPYEKQRDRPVNEILYQDAKRRQQSIENRKQEAIAKSLQPVPLVSRESQKLVIQKFEREINAGIFELFQAQRDLSIENLIKDDFIQLPSSMNYLSMKLLMVRLGCCSEDQTFTECPESELLFEMWKYLSQDQHHNQTDDDLPTDRLKLFSMVILRVAEPRILQDYLRNTEHGFNFEEAQPLIKKFELFYLNRLQSQTRVQMIKKADMESLQTQDLSFKPQLSQTTIQLAQRKQTRQKPNHLTRPTAGAVMNTFFNTREAQELSECTFKPSIMSNSRKLSQNRRLVDNENQSLAEPLDKCAELFEHAKQLHQVKQTIQDKTTEQVEYERGKEECTFKPVISNSPHFVPKPINSELAKLHIQRQTKAREERERVKEITERGYSSKREGSANSRHQTSVGSTATFNQLQNKRPLGGSLLKKKVEDKRKGGTTVLNQDLRIPLLLVDIGIGNRKERIAVYEGDRADTLAKDFCIRHGLDIENIAVRLQEEIERQIEMISMNGGVVSHLEESPLDQE